MLWQQRLLEAVGGLALGALSLGLAQARVDVAPAPPPAPTAPSTNVDPTAPADEKAIMRAHAQPVADYALHASLDAAAHCVHGEGTITWRNSSSVSVRELWVHLYLNGFKNERSLFLRAPGTSGRGRSPVSSWGYIDVKKMVARELDGLDLWTGADHFSPNDPDDQTDIRVPLPSAVAPGATLTLDVSWDAQLPNVVERTGFSGDFHMVAQWFPKLARLEPSGVWRHFPFYHLTEFYADFGSYDVTLDVPSGMVVGATGSRVSFESAAGRDHVRYRQDDVHDFAWTAWSRFHEKSASVAGVAVRLLYPPGYDHVAERELAALAFALPYFGEHYGPYPYPVLTVVHPPREASEAGGMEYPTLITTSGEWYEPQAERAIEAVTIHEFGHQYFYGLVATDEQLWPLLDEGINSYAETDALAAWLGSGAAVQFLGLRMSADAALRLAGVRASHNEPVAQPAQAFANGGDYGALVYGRTATLLRTLGGVYGHDKMRQALGQYARRYRFEHPGMEQLLSSVREVLGEGATEQLEQGLYRKGWVDYLVADAASHRDDGAAGLFDRGGKRETVVRNGVAAETWEGSVLIMRHGTLTFPVQVAMWGQDGTQQIAHWDGSGDWVRLRYEGSSELSRVMVDPDVRITADENLFNNALRITPAESGRRTLERVTYFAELALQWLSPW